MSGWTGVAVVGVALIVAFVAVGQPLWQWQSSGSSQTETWSYGLFGATHTVANSTTGNTTTATYDYSNLPNQPAMASAFLDAQRAFLLTIVADLAGLAFSVAAGLRRLRGVFAGASLLSGCLLSLYVSLTLVVAIPAAGVELPPVGGRTVVDFEGQIIVPSGTGVGIVASWGPGLAWYLALGVALILAFGATEVWNVRPRMKAKTLGAAAAAPARSAAAPPPPAPEPADPTVEEVFVIGANGLLIKHMSRTLMSDKDRDVVGSMISVLSNFVRESFSERDGQIQEVTLGEHRFVMASDRGIVVAALVTSGDTEDVLHRLRHLLAVILDRYGSKLEDWQGAPLEGIEDEMAVIWEPYGVPPPPVD